MNIIKENKIGEFGQLGDDDKLSGIAHIKLGSEGDTAKDIKMLTNIAESMDGLSLEGGQIN